MTATSPIGITCSKCGKAAQLLGLYGWWLRDIATYAWWCDVCADIETADYGDHGDEHVDSPTASAALHAHGIEHPTRTCRVCIAAGVPLRPDVRWVGSPEVS